MLVLFSSVALLVPLITAIIFQEWILQVITPFPSVFAHRRFGLLMRIEPGRLEPPAGVGGHGSGLGGSGLWPPSRCTCRAITTRSLDAMFDGVSGITYHGRQHHLRPRPSFLRRQHVALRHDLLGGLGLVVVALSFGLFGKRSGASLFVSEGRSEHKSSQRGRRRSLIAKLSLGFILVATTVLAIMCAFAGMEAPRAVLNGLWLAISSFCTGGFTPMSASIMYYHSLPIEVRLWCSRSSAA